MQLKGIFLLDIYQKSDQAAKLADERDALRVTNPDDPRIKTISSNIKNMVRDTYEQNGERTWKNVNLVVVRTTYGAQ